MTSLTTIAAPVSNCFASSFLGAREPDPWRQPEDLSRCAFGGVTERSGGRRCVTVAYLRECSVFVISGLPRYLKFPDLTLDLAKARRIFSWLSWRGPDGYFLRQDLANAVGTKHRCETLSSVVHRRRTTQYVWLAIAVVLGIASFLLLRRSANAFNQAAGYASIFGLFIALYATFQNKSGAETFGQADYDHAVQTLSERVTRTEGMQRQRLLDRAADPAPMILRSAEFLRSYRSHAQPQEADSMNIFSVFWGMKSKRMLLLGEAGAGKTLLLLELIRQAAEARRSNPNVPIFIRMNIAEWRDDHSFRDYFAGQVAAQHFLPTKLIARMLDDGRLIPLLDGLDEFDPEDSPPIRGVDAIARLNKIADGSYPVNAPLVVTCRKTYFQALENLQIDSDEMVGLARRGLLHVGPAGC